MASKILLAASVLLNLAFASYIFIFSSSNNASWNKMSSDEKKRACVSYAKEKVLEFASKKSTQEKEEQNKSPLSKVQRKPLEGFDDAPVKRIEISKDELKEYTSNLPKVLRDAKAVPYVEPGSGSISGLKVVMIKTGSVYERLGIQKQDVVKGFNGKEIATPQHAMQLYQSLKSSDTINLHILRAGKPLTLKYLIE